MYIPTGISDPNNVNKSPFHPGSSNIDWCEPNYVVSEHIAEFWNTVSNIFFFLVPPIMIILFASYSKRVANGITILWVFLIIIGIGSVYFHATLSLAGQLVDEISILWVIMAGYAIFLPAMYTPTIYSSQTFRVRRAMYNWGMTNTPQKRQFVFGCVVLGIIVTCLSVVYPYANAFALMILGLPAIAFMAIYLSRSDNYRIRSLGVHCLGSWALAVTIWICDRMFCSFWISISFPYLHAIWHVLILFSSNEAIVVCAYLLIKYQYPQANLLLHVWPNENWGSFSLPYLKFHDDGNYLTSSSESLATKSIV